MPYIKQEDRQWLIGVEDALEESGVATAGEIQYLISLVIREFLKDNELRYATFNEVMGALAGAQQEFYREVVAPYEDICIEKNGGISGYNDLFSDDKEEVSGWTILKDGHVASYSSGPLRSK